MNTNKPIIKASPSYQEQTCIWYDSIEGHFSREDKVHGTSDEDSMDPIDIPFLVPEGYSASLTIHLGVDDWGKLTIIDSSGGERLTLSLTMNDEEAGPRGGHAYWSKEGSVVLPSGTYSLHVEQSNTTYPEQYDSRHNVSKCDFTVAASLQKKGVRDVKIIITGLEEGMYHGARSFPRTIEKADGSIQFYEVPIYRMYLRGKNDKGEQTEQFFQVLRFMPGFNPDPDYDETCRQYRKWPILSMVGLKDDQEIKTTFIEHPGTLNLTMAPSCSIILSFYMTVRMREKMVTELSAVAKCMEQKECKLSKKALPPYRVLKKARQKKKFGLSVPNKKSLFPSRRLPDPQSWKPTNLLTLTADVEHPRFFIAFREAVSRTKAIRRSDDANGGDTFARRYVRGFRSIRLRPKR